MAITSSMLKRASRRLSVGLQIDVTRGGIRRLEVDPRDFGLAPCAASELAGAGPEANLTALRKVFGGGDRGPHRAALVLQCGLALFIAGRARSIAEGIAAANAALDSGRAQ